jgi:DNA repair protein RecO (recombination protein O)
MIYKKLTGLVLKKQNYREADQMVTLWTRDEGKIRVMARGLRLGKSKLAFSMQDLSLVEFETAGRKNLPALISARAVKTFRQLREDLSKTVAAFYASELILKMTADEQPNPEAFDLSWAFFEHLDGADIAGQPLFSLIDSFSLQLLRSLGFSIEHAPGALGLPADLSGALAVLADCQFVDLPRLNLDEAQARQSHGAVKNFIEYILERNINSERFLLSH